MRILFLSPRQCWPAKSGAKLREYHFLRALGEDSEVSYIYFQEPGSYPLTLADLPFCRTITGVAKPPTYSKRQMLEGAAGKWPLPILNYSSTAMKAAVEQTAAAGSYDLIHLDSIHMIRYGQQLAAKTGGVGLVYNWHNIESEAMNRYSATVESGSRRWYGRLTARKLAVLEHSLLQTGLGHVVCSDRERLVLQAIAPEARIKVVENGVDVSYFAGAGKSLSGDPPRKLVFVGSMDYFPNIEGITIFVKNIWPRLRECLPDTELAIVGANPTSEVLALAQIPGITVTGTVPDVRPWYANALAAIVPLRTGGGTRLKILEAMAAGVPVISTPLGAEGLDISSDRNILLVEADDTEAWVARLTALNSSTKMAAQLRDAAFDLVRSRYDWQILGATLCQTYRSWLVNL